MNPLWIHLAARFLQHHSGCLAGRTCHDWRWPEHWSQEARRELCRAMVADNLRLEPEQLTPEQLQTVEHYATGVHGPPNWWVVAFLADQCKEYGL